MAIAFVAAATAFSRIGSGTTWTWNKPAGVSAGHLMIASVQFDANGSQRTVTLPSGWTLIRNAYDGGSGTTYEAQQVTAYRFVESGDPSSWGGTLSGSVLLTAANVVAYSGVQSVGASGASSNTSSTSLASPSVATGSVSGPRRVVCGAYVSTTTNYTIASNETTRRTLFAADDTGSSGATQAAIWDSNTTTVSINTTTSRTISRSAVWAIGVVTILMLTPSSGTPASGTLGGTLGAVEAVAEGEVHDDATLAASLSPVTFAGSGEGQPIPPDAVLAASLPPVQASVSGGTEVTGVMAAAVLPSLSFEGETRVFGVRVITVEAEDRTIRVESRAVAD